MLKNMCLSVPANSHSTVLVLVDMEGIIQAYVILQIYFLYPWTAAPGFETGKPIQIQEERKCIKNIHSNMVIYITQG